MKETQTVTAPAGGDKDRQETVMFEGPSLGGAGSPATPPEAMTDRAWLIDRYRRLLRDRAIRYPATYLMTRELGKGRQGSVFLAARHGARGCLTRHAIKVFDPSIYRTSESYWTDMGRIASQISKLQPIHNDNLVSRDFYDECNGIGFIQMAAIDGIDLQYLMDGSHLAITRSQSTDREWSHFMDVLFRVEDGCFRLQPGIAIYILRKALIGLSVMHREGFLHGDIKPSNIMIDRNGSIKLVDFGRAATIGEPVNILLGSPLYMAPEIHRMEPGFAQSDLFSAGLVGLEMICGRLWNPDIDVERIPEEKIRLHERIEQMVPPYARENKLLIYILKKFTHIDPAWRYATTMEAEDSDQGLRGIHRQLSLVDMDAEYDRELQRYMEKLNDPSTGHVNPRMG